MTSIPVHRFGPFARGVIDSAGVTQDLQGAMRYARNARFEGAGRLLVRGGTVVAMTLMDDQMVPAHCTSVVALCTFGDGALAVAHSTVTSKFYLYWLKDDLTGWYDASKVLTSNASALPVGVLWTAAGAKAKVTIAEGLGVAYIAHSNAGVTFKSMKFDSTAGPPATLTAFQANLDGTGVKDTYFRGFVSFQQHLWGWGYGSQAAGDNDRPELLRFSTPFFGPMSQADSFAVGHRVRSQRERVVAGVVAGEGLYFGTNYSIWPVTGFGRDSWDKSRPLDDSYGFSGLFAAIAGGDGYLYYNSHRGPLRVRGGGPPEPLWPKTAAAWQTIVGDGDVIVTFDDASDQVLFLYQNGSSGRVSVLAAFDTIREVWLGPDGDVGIGVGCASLITPALALGPAGPPTNASTTDIGSTVATANFDNGDTSPGTQAQVRWRQQGGSVWTYSALLPVSGVPMTYQITGLTPGVAYEWAAANIRNGQTSAYLGPSAPTQFVTAANQLLAPSDVVIDFVPTPGKTTWDAVVSWTNSGEGGVSTEIHFLGPQAGAPASGSLPNVGTVSPGESSAPVGIGTSNGKFWAEVRHVKSGFLSSPYAGGPASAVGPA